MLTYASQSTRGLAVSNPLDATAAAQGASSSSNSGTAQVPAGDLLVGANLVQGKTKSPGTSWVRRIITSPDGDILEDRVISTAGAYGATASITNSQWIMQMVAFRAASGVSGDTQPPTVPSNPTATAVGASQINVTWTASTDNVGVTGYLVERCSGIGCSNFSQVAAPLGTTYADMGLTSSTSYSYRVRAKDAAGNLSGYSSVVSATTAASGDTQPPTAPGTLAASAVSATQVNLTWGAATDNVGVTGYSIERCQGSGCSTFAQVTVVPGTTFGDAALTTATTYSYRVRATDAAGNSGPYSNVASATTLAGTPSLVAAYSFNEGTGSTVADASGNGNTGTLTNTSWTGSGKYGSALTFNGASSIVTIADVAALHLTTGMTLEAWVNPALTTSWRDVIYKGNDNYYLEGTSPAGAPLAGVTLSPSNNINAGGAAPLPLNTWTHLAETYDGSTLRLYVNGVQASAAAGTGSILTSTNPLEIGGDHLYGQYFQGMIDEVRIYSTALTPTQIQADMAAPIGGGGDTQSPTVPGNAGATAVSATQIDLAWTASSDNVGVTGYLVERCSGGGCSSFAQVAGPIGTTTYSDTGLTASTSYSYRVRATDAAGNLSGYSSVATATTLAASGDTQPPSAPGTLAATAMSGTQVNLSWGAATDNVGVTGYRVERCQGSGCSDFVKLIVVTATTFVDSGLTPNTTYNYIVRATDAAGNLGAYSNVASVTTLGTTPALVAAYSFNEGTGSTVADTSGNGNTGMLANTTWTASGKYGPALVFNGSTSVVTVADAASLRLTIGMTLEAWVKPAVTATSWRDVIYKGNDNYYLEGSSSSGGVPAAGVTLAPSTGVNAYASSALAANVWTHLAETYDGNNLRLYVNGVQVSLAAGTGNILTSPNALEIGGDHLYGQHFQGTIDEIRIYNTALTPTQIQADMSTPVASNTPVANLSASTLDFGTRAINTTTQGSPITLSNIGGAALSIDSIGVSGANATDFAQTSNCPASLAPATSCSITVSFTPSAAGTRTATLVVQDNASGSPHTVSLSGSGTPVLVTPGIATLTPGQSQQFSASSASGSSYTWSVDGTIGGSSTVGTITSTGFYTAPGTAGSHTVTATSNLSQSGTATAFVVTYTGTFTYHNDNARTGLNSQEVALAPASVNSARFGKLRSFPLDGQAIASPLYAAGVTIPGNGVHNVVYVATEHDSVYAFDADGSGATPLWQVSFINPAAAVTTVPAGDTGECCDIAPEIGITSAPVIDPATATMYVVAKTKEVVGSSTNYVQRLHALDIGTGAEKFGGPVVITATVPGTGIGSNHGQLPFNSLLENQRTALLLNSGRVYMAFASHGDNQPYHGWVFAYSAATLQQVVALCVTANGEGAGIWQSGDGLASDAAGNIYFITGDGTFDANTGGSDYGDSYVKIGPDGAVLDYFTPANQATLDSGNIDLGAGGPMLLPDQPGAHPHLLVSAGKNGSIDLVNRDSMGHYNATGGDSQIVQTLPNIFPFGTPEPGNYSAATYFNGTVYFSPVADNLQAFTLTNGLLSTSATSRSPEIYPYPGGTTSISSNGTTNGIVWAIQVNGTSAPAVLRAYDATNLGIELYSSDQNTTRDGLDPAAKFTAPLIANGKVFVTSSGRLTVYGLLP